MANKLPAMTAKVSGRGEKPRFQQLNLREAADHIGVYARYLAMGTWNPGQGKAGTARKRAR